MKLFVVYCWPESSGLWCHNFHSFPLLRTAQCYPGNCLTFELNTLHSFPIFCKLKPSLAVRPPQLGCAEPLQPDFPLPQPAKPSLWLSWELLFSTLKSCRAILIQSTNMTNGFCNSGLQTLGSSFPYVVFLINLTKV